MTTPRPQLSREEAFRAFTEAGWPSGMFTANTGVRMPFQVLWTAVAGAESDLMVDAQGVPNANGTVDRGWLQINSVHEFDQARILSDPTYTAECALQILLGQGVRAWYAYQLNGAPGPYVRRLPPSLGGPDVGIGTKSVTEINKTVQAYLNTSTLITTKLVVDGAFGPRSEAALVTWKRANHNDGTKVVDGRCWIKMGLR